MNDDSGTQPIMTTLQIYIVKFTALGGNRNCRVNGVLFVLSGKRGQFKQRCIAANAARSNSIQILAYLPVHVLAIRIRDFSYC